MNRLDRRTFLNVAGAAGIGLVAAGCRESGSRPPLPPPEPPVQLVRFPEKTDLILITDRAPQLETPLKYFRSDLTPNEAHYVRWHLTGIPTSVDTKTWRLKILGNVERTLALSLDDLKRNFEQVSMVAVNQCSGNSRSFFEPKVPGTQWRHGGMGNAKWTGVRVKDLLDKAGVKAGAIEVSFRGMDEPPMKSVERFIKPLAIDHARDGEVLLAHSMNDAPLPMLNGFPVRLVVPGWYATYWVKAVDEISVLSDKFKGYWIDTAYRIPVTPDASEKPDNLATETTPITKIALHSIFVRPEPGESLRAGQPYELEGLALDSGLGIKSVEISADGGRTWNQAKLDPDLGRYSWRRWRLGWTPTTSGPAELLVRAVNQAGETQRESFWNRSGYMRNVIERVSVTVS